MCEEGEEVGAKRQHLGTYVAFTLKRRGQDGLNWAQGQPVLTSHVSWPRSGGAAPETAEKGRAPGFHLLIFHTPLANLASLDFRAWRNGPTLTPAPAPVLDVATNVDLKRHTPQGQEGQAWLTRPSSGAKRHKVSSGSTVGGTCPCHLSS